MTNLIPKYILSVILLAGIASTGFSQQVLPVGKGVGINGEVFNVKADSFHQRLYVSGNFNSVSGVEAPNIAYMDSTGWHAFADAIYGVSDIEISPNELFVAGNLTINGNSDIHGIARWDGINWYPLGSGISDGYITDMVYFQSKLFVFGGFTIAGDSTVTGAAVWDGSNWSSFFDNSENNLRGVFIHKDSLFLITSYSLVWPDYFHTLYRYNGIGFDSVSSQIMNYSYVEQASINDTLFVLTSKGLYSFQNNTWNTEYMLPYNTYSDGLFSLNNSLYLLLDSFYTSIHLFKNSTAGPSLVDFHGYTSSGAYVRDHDEFGGSVYIGGDFALANNEYCLSLCAFDGQAPSSPGWFTGYGGDVFASYFDSTNNNLYAAGNFNWAGDSMASSIARWDGSEWHPMGNGLDNVTYSIVKFQDELYASGNFISSGADTLNYIARWDGTKWNSVDGGANDYVRCLEIHNNKLIAGGGFTSIGGVAASYIAQYDGTSWSPLPGGSLESDVHTMKEVSGTLYVGGYEEILNGSSTARFTDSWSVFGYTTKNITGFLKFNDTLYMSTDQPKVYKYKSGWVSTGYSPYFDYEYSQLINLDGNLCVSTLNNDLWRYETGEWKYILGLTAYTASKINDSTYFVGGRFSTLYSPIDALPFGNTTLFVSSKPTAAIATDKNSICKHQYIFYNSITNDPFLKYEWHFPGGFTDTSTYYEPVVLYDSVGTFGAYAVITNWNGVDTIYMQDSITVTDCPNSNIPSYDNAWFLGYTYSKYKPRPGLDFFYGSPDSMGHSALTFQGFSTSISDKNGELQLYSNGEQLANRYHQIVAQSKDFNDDEYFEDNNSSYSPYSQCMLILPYPDHAQQYFLVHTSPRYSDDHTLFAPFQLWYSIVKMKLNNGEGKMTVKQQPILYDTLTFSTMQAERHANGRDWWIIIHKYKSDKLYLLLLTPEGISQINLVSAGPVVKTAGLGQSVFSPDGKTFALCASDSSVVHIFHFDRCEGALTFSHSIKFDYTISGGSLLGCAFSADSRYLYVSSYSKLFQIDTTCWTIDSCRQLIGEHDGFSLTQFSRMKLGPDNKIYMATYHGSEYLHVINNPDAAGVLAGFVQRQVKLISYSSSTIPQFPNFRAGVLEGSICDTLDDIATAVPDASPQVKIELQIAPNPSGEITFFHITNATEPTTSLTIYNSSLQKVFHQTIKTNSSFSANVSSWSKGIYFCRVINGSAFTWKKLIVQ